MMHIRNLNFSHRANYDEQFAPQSLHGLELHIRRGSKIALILLDEPTSSVDPGIEHRIYQRLFNEPSSPQKGQVLQMAS